MDISAAVVADIRAKLAAIDAALPSAAAPVPPPPTPVPPPPGTLTIDLHPGDNLQTAIDAATAGSTLRLAAGTYDGALVISKSVHLASAVAPSAMATADSSVWIVGHGDQTLYVTPDAHDVSFVGIGVKNTNANGELVYTQGSHVLFDRCTLLGDPVHAQHRGFRVEGKQTTITGCYVDDVFAIGRDSACIGSWQDCDGLIVDNCYLRGGAETIMFGGADSPSADRIPKNIRITNCTLTHKPEWYAMGTQRKTPFELKAAQHVYMADCVLEYAGISEGQGAYLLVITVRNQDGGAPWSCIEDVLIERCTCRYGGGAINILGRDYLHPSGILDGVTIRDCTFTDLNPVGPWSHPGNNGSGRGVLFGNAPRNVTLDGITLEGVNMGALGYFDNTPNQPVGLTLRNWKYFTSDYGWKIDDGGLDMPPASKNLQALMPDLVYAITPSDAGAKV